MNHMSLIAMKICEDGIIAFADSKASREDEKGHIFEDVQRGKIKKIFKNDKFIVATCGNNEIFTVKGILYIENVIEDILSSESIQEFAFQFFDKIQNDGRAFHFLFGYKDTNEGYIIQPYIIDKDGIHPQSKMNNHTVMYVQGEEKYIDILKRMSLVKYNTIQKARKNIKQILNNLIIIFNHYNEYNTVGFPIKVEVFQ